MVSIINVPKHIAIIMDGNGRWAANKGLPRRYGHSRGVRSVRRVIDYCLGLGIEYLTLYTFSTENWKRPKKEVDMLMKMLEENIGSNLTELAEEKNIRVRIIGDWKVLPGELPQKIEKVIHETEGFDRLNLTLAINYGARQEIVNAAVRIASDFKSGKIKLEEFNEPFLSNYLYTFDLPDPDLLIRTAGEYRISNYLLWQAAYTELYTTTKLWPDFRKSDLIKAIKNYKKCRRKYGSL
ncbi:MAG: polyprenyl diphosphate synthase [Candidatus Kaelpia imicola]|nr:polyprenyl diphosphate synthase [Candidatus Kaelpia imicola]